MKKQVLLGVFTLALSFGVFAQNGKTYYDAEKTKPKEVYSFKAVTSFNPLDPESSNSAGSIKDGPYFYYYESGKLKISGSYHNDQKNGDWKYYDESGKLIKTEKYSDGKLIQ